MSGIQEIVDAAWSEWSAGEEETTAGRTSVEQYLTALPQDARRALEQLRETIKAAVPDATDTISYRIPAVKARGKTVVAYAAFKDHCSFYPMSTAVIEEHRRELEPYLSGKGTLRFTADAPLPKSLVTRIVKARLREVAARGRG